ncbi:reverse transcriptase [Phytophthora megakarya]|uniref:Reverse transcriptase n=1 Tax=Phytophthora megakarya TaxID=4795 RepID=A0A225VJK4_9STRA|nr:reverse transcriptase [Phytophthora megakarya]
MTGPRRNGSESGIHKKKRRRKHKRCASLGPGSRLFKKKMELVNLPTDTSESTSLPVMSWKRFAKDLATESEDTLSAKKKKELFDEQSWDSLKSRPYYEILRDHRDVLPDEIPAELLPDKGIQHEVDLVPGTKYCVTRQWPLPREQVKAIDDFFESRRKAGQTPIPRKDVIIDSMSKSTIYSALDLRDGFYQILMRESDIPLTAVNTPSGMLWEWVVMPQGQKNTPATFNRCVTHLLRSVRDFAPSYFDDVYVHSRAVEEKTDVEMHKEHLRELLGLMLKHKLYANLKKCIFGASDIPVLGCLVGKNGVRPDPEKVRVINEWPTPSNVKELRQFLALATYLCKYVDNYAGKIRPLSQLLKKEAAWEWTAECQQAFDAVKLGLTETPILAVADQDRPFHVVCDAADLAIGCASMQLDHEGRDREFLAMKYALAKFRVYLLDNTPFVVHTDHASLRAALKSPHISQQMARWLSFFAEHNFRVEYKPGRLNVADALLRRPDYAVKTVDVNQIDVARTYTPSSFLLDEVNDSNAKQLIEFLSAPSDKARWKLAPRLRAGAHRYRVHDGLLFYSAVDDNADRIVVPNDPDLPSRIMYEYHDVPTAGHPGREKTYSLLTREFYWNHHYKWVRKYIMHLAAVAAEVTSVQMARLFVDMVFKHHGMPNDFVSDRDLRFTARFWQEVFTLLGTQFSMSTADHPRTDRQTERLNRVLVDLLKSYAQSFHNWSDYLPMAEFTINNANTADIDLSAAMTRARARARTRQGDVSVPGSDTVKNHEQATPVSSKDNMYVRGTDTL